VETAARQRRPPSRFDVEIRQLMNFKGNILMTQQFSVATIV